jgi:hypothetical protein
VSFAMVCSAAQRSTDAQTYLDQLCQMDAGIAQAHGVAQAFLAMVRERRGEDLEAGMAEATCGGVEELARFARSCRLTSWPSSRVDPGVEQWRHRRPNPSPEAREAPGLWASWFCAVAATRPASSIGMERGAPDITTPQFPSHPCGVQLRLPSRMYPEQGQVNSPPE